MIYKRLSVFVVLITFSTASSKAIAQNKISVELSSSFDYSLIDRKIDGEYIFEQNEIIPKINIGISLSKKRFQYLFKFSTFTRSLEYDLYKLLPDEEISGYLFITQREIRDFERTSHRRLLKGRYLNTFIGIRHLSNESENIKYIVTYKIGPEIRINGSFQDIAIDTSREQFPARTIKSEVISWTSQDLRVGATKKITDKFSLSGELGLYISNILFQDIHSGLTVRVDYFL